MSKYSILSQLYESADRFWNKYETPDLYPEWAIDQISDKERQLELNLECDSIIRENYNG